MRAELRLIDRHWAELREHLLADGDEHAGLLLCGVVKTSRAVIMAARGWIPLTEQDMLSSGSLHLSVSPIALAREAKRAAGLGLSLVLCHSHPWSGSATPSRLDLDTEQDLCGRVLSRRLQGLPSGGLVVGPEDVSGRAWVDGDPIAMTLRIIGDESAVWPAPSPGPVDARVDRQVLAWGQLGQSRLQDARVAVIGAGGTGSHVIVQLAHLGVGYLLLIDPDEVEESNLSRIVGAALEDVGRSKVHVLRDSAQRINGSLVVDTRTASVLDVDPRVLADCDLVVCATDGHGSRALLTELAQQYLTTVVDLGVEVVPREGGAQAGGQVRVLRPGRACLHCAGTLDPALVREEYLTDADRQQEDARGYLRGLNAPAPAVIALNGVVASIAVLEICQLLAGFLGSSAGRVLFRANRRAVTTASLEAEPWCYVCGEEGLLGLGDARNLPVRRSGDVAASGD